MNPITINYAFTLVKTDGHLSTYTISTRMAIAKEFARFCMRRLRIDKDPGRGVKVRSPRPKPPSEGSLLSEAEFVKRINEYFSKPYHRAFEALRDVTLAYLLFTTGPRISAALGIQLKDLHLEGDKPYVMVKERGWHRRENPYTRIRLSIEVVNLIRRLIDSNQVHGHGLPWLFVKRNRLFGGGYEYGQCTPGRMGYRIKMICGTRPHNLRHSLAVNMLKANVPLNIVQSQLGHQNIATTSIYTRPMESVAEKYWEEYIEKQLTRNMGDTNH